MTGVLQTEFEFTLPNGYADDDGELHRNGAMRLATAADEIKPTKDPRVQSNPSYMTVILLSRVITDLGSLDEVTPHVVENLFVSDLAYLQNMYERINERGANTVEATCPECTERFEVRVTPEDGGEDAVVPDGGLVGGAVDADPAPDGVDVGGATTRGSTDRLFEEAAFVAYHFNWDLATVLDLPHSERKRWCVEISHINERINEAGE